MLTKTNFLYILCVKLDSPNKRNASMYFLLFFYNHYHLTSRALSGFFFYESFSLHERKVWYDNSTNKGGQTMAFLPTTREEMLEQGFEQVDFVYVNGDAYVDHLLLDVQSLPECCRHMDIAVRYWHSQTGIRMKNFYSLENLDWGF